MGALWLKLIDLKFNSTLTEKFYASHNESKSNYLRNITMKILIDVVSIYICERKFLADNMKNKTLHSYPTADNVLYFLIMYNSNMHLNHKILLKILIETVSLTTVYL
ncbi:hypothetical protein RF11_04494 [Thelohanellus kitauei]|uniref:Uncharacterized protein n=1 Tax=Thelohanellus kitauei TaxID=669202 RepID=A0A0C2IW13_THEKT|nr:hypothetical protein RF11_04494 [Thelohanellus kitauei]